MHRQVRIAFLIGTLEVGGAERQLVRLANGLDREMFEPEIICLSRGGPLEAEVDSDIPVTKLDQLSSPQSSTGGRARYGARILVRLYRHIRRQQPAIVHAYLPSAYILGGLVAWLARVPVIVAGRRGLTSYQTYSPPWQVLARIANRLIDVHVCNSVAVRNWAVEKEGIPIARTRVVHNGIDLGSGGSRAELPSEWAAASGCQAAMVANLISYKGHRWVLGAVATAVSRHRDFGLVLFGDGAERQELTALVARLEIADNVVFAGARPDAPALLAEFDFSLIGSSEEGLPNAVMESMAAGLPVVASAVGGVLELIEDGVEGKLVPYGDDLALVEAIDWMIDHPRERREMGQRGRRRIEEHFSAERMVSAMQDIYSELLTCAFK